MEEIGLFGGTFNPPTCAHEKVGQVAFSDLALDRLLVVPNRTPVHKLLANGPGAHARLKMCQAMCLAHPGWEAVDWELARPGPSYTLDTVRQLARAYPRARRWLILGADAAWSLPDWEHSTGLTSLVNVAVVQRPGYPELDSAALTARMPGLNLRVLPGDRTLSSTQTRARLADGRDAGALLPAGVAALIAAGGWYR